MLCQVAKRPTLKCYTLIKSILKLLPNLNSARPFVATSQRDNRVSRIKQGLFVAEKIRKDIEKHQMIIEKQDVIISVSIGISVARSPINLDP